MLAGFSFVYHGDGVIGIADEAFAFGIGGEFLAGQRAGAALPSPISREEAALLDNYRHSSPEGKKAIKATSDALAKPSSGNGGKKSA